MKTRIIRCWKTTIKRWIFLAILTAFVIGAIAAVEEFVPKRPRDFPPSLLVAFLFGLVLVIWRELRYWKLFKLRKRKVALLREIPLSSISETEPGTVKICGRVKASPEQLLTSPWTEKQCVYYFFYVQQWKSGGENSNDRWVTVINDSKWVDCLLIEDDTGVVEVPAKKIDFTVKSDGHLQSGRKSAPRELESMLQERYGRSTKRLFGSDKDMRYSEYALDEGDMVCALGSLALQGDRRCFDANYPYTMVSDLEEGELIASLTPPRAPLFVVLALLPVLFFLGVIWLATRFV